MRNLKLLKKINFKNFTQSQLNSISIDVDIIAEGIRKGDNLTISNFADIKINKGSENLYLTLLVYINDRTEPNKMYISTKEDIQTLKEIIKEIVNQL